MLRAQMNTMLRRRAFLHAGLTMTAAGFLSLRVPLLGRADQRSSEPQDSRTLPVQIWVDVHGVGQQTVTTPSPQEWAGNRGGGHGLNAFWLSPKDPLWKAQLEYSAKFGNAGVESNWTDWAATGRKVGLGFPPPEGVRPDASGWMLGLRVRIVGQNAKEYSVSYRGHFSIVADSTWVADAAELTSKAVIEMPQLQRMQAFSVVILHRRP